jgi:AhpD family alkylhydroperoxidase
MSNINGCAFCQYAHDALTNPKKAAITTFAEGLLVGASGVEMSMDCCEECAPMIRDAMAKLSDRPPS